MASDLVQAFSDFGGAASDLFGAKGSDQSSASYLTAAAIAEQNAKISAAATNIKEQQETREIYKVLGKQRAGVGGAGFAEKGTALDLLRDSASQGALTKAITAEQGSINVNSYEEQAGLYSGLAGAAKSAGNTQRLGGVLQAAGGLLNLGTAAAKAGLIGSSATTSVSGAELAATAAADDAAFGATALGTTDALAAAGVSSAAVDAGVTAAAGDVAATAFEAAAVDTGASIGVADVAAVAAWIVCTELHRQGRMPSRIYYTAAPEFLEYPERGKRGYYVWAIPSTRHLRAHPNSLYSRFLERLFNCRAQYVSARRRGRATTWTGALVTNGLYAFCWSLSWFIPASFARWQALYEGAR